MEDAAYKYQKIIIQNLQVIGRPFVINKDEIQVDVAYGLKCIIREEKKQLRIFSALFPYNAITGLIKMKLES